MSNKVTETAQIQCDKGSIPTQLKVTSQNFNEFEGKLIATEEDAKANGNIIPFGSCKLKNNSPCVPATKKWIKTSELDEINNKKIVLEKSECACSIGGKITILQNGHGGKIQLL